MDEMIELSTYGIQRFSAVSRLVLAMLVLTTSLVNTYLFSQWIRLPKALRILRVTPPAQYAMHQYSSYDFFSIKFTS